MTHNLHPTVLVVEDTADIRRVVTLILSTLGYTVISVPNGERCMEAARQHHPDLVLMDLSMPLMDGWEATRCLKADATTAHIPVLAFTAHVQESELDRARAAGCANVITKPFDIDDLLSQIEIALRASTIQQAAPRRNAPNHLMVRAFRGGLRRRVVGKERSMLLRSSMRAAIQPAEPA